MRVKEIPMIMIAILILTTGMSLFLADEVDAQETSEVRMYLHNTFTLDTIPPETNEIVPYVLTSSEDGTEVSFSTSFPITEELLITGINDGGNRILTLHLPISETTGITTSHNLDVRVVIVSSSGTEIQVAGAIFTGDDMEADDLILDLTSNDGSMAPLDSNIELRFKLTGSPGTFPPSTFSFGFYGNADSSYLGIIAKPIKEENIEISLTDQEGFPIEELLPNGPPSSRSFNIIISVIDSFGAYDIEDIRIILSSDVGNVIWNTTGEPDENGGERIAYFNSSYTIPEGTPEGTYIIEITVTSHTGIEVIALGDLELTSGLQISIDDPDKDADAGDTIEFSVDILNGGEGMDRVTFSFESEIGWNVDFPDPLEVEGGMTETVVFRVFVPLRSTAGEEDSIELMAESNNAGKTYSRMVTVFVEKAAVFGVEPIGETTRSVVSGGGVQFSIRVVNIQNEEKTYEMGLEDQPFGWTVSYGGENGSTQGSIFVVELPGEGEAEITINLMTDVSSEGVHDLSVYVRERGNTDRKYVYFKVRVVDMSRPVLALLDTTDTKSSNRVGSNLPIMYSDVFFNLEIYNPSLIGANIRINVFGPTNWVLEYVINNLDLLPGELSKWNISITPKNGEIYQETPFEIEIEVVGGDLGTHSQKLNVELKKITLVEASSDKNGNNLQEGKDILINITLKNNGNHPVDLSITVEFPQELQITFDPQSVSMEANDDAIVRMTVTLVEVKEEGSITFSIKYSGDGVNGNKDISVFGIKKDDPGSTMDPILIIALIGIVIVVLVGGYFGYTKFFKGSRKEPANPQPKKKNDAFDGVKVEAAPAPIENRAKPVRAPTSSRVFQEADDIAASILASDSDRMDLGGGVTVEAEPEFVEAVVVTAEIVE